MKEQLVKYRDRAVAKFREYRDGLGAQVRGIEVPHRVIYSGLAGLYIGSCFISIDETAKAVLISTGYALLARECR